MVDRAAKGKDGSFAYSRIRSVDFDNTYLARIYPNPASSSLFLDDYSKLKSVVIYNREGSKLLEEKR